MRRTLEVGFVGILLIATVFLLFNLPTGESHAKSKTLHEKTGFYRINRITWEGHTYIDFAGSTSSNGVVHDPDCPCKK